MDAGCSTANPELFAFLFVIPAGDLLFARTTINPGCPILSAQFAEWVGTTTARTNAFRAVALPFFLSFPLGESASCSCFCSCLCLCSCLSFCHSPQENLLFPSNPPQKRVPHPFRALAEWVGTTTARTERLFLSLIPQKPPVPRGMPRTPETCQDTLPQRSPQPQSLQPDPLTPNLRPISAKGAQYHWRHSAQRTIAR